MLNSPVLIMDSAGFQILRYNIKNSRHSRLDGFSCEKIFFSGTSLWIPAFVPLVVLSVSRKLRIAKAMVAVPSLCLDRSVFTRREEPRSSIGQTGHSAS